MRIKTWEEARLLGEKLFYTGKLCRNGHDSPRHVSSRNCLACKAAWEKQKRLRMSPETRKDFDKKRYERDYSRRPYAYKEAAKRRKAALGRATPPWVDREELRRVYRDCPPGMTVDHIHALKGVNFCGLHVPWNLQYLSPRENRLKSNHLAETAKMGD